MKAATVLVFRYGPRERPIPRGWRIAHDLGDCNHGPYSVLIEKVGAA